MKERKAREFVSRETDSLTHVERVRKFDRERELEREREFDREFESSRVRDSWIDRFRTRNGSREVERGRFEREVVLTESVCSREEMARERERES